MIKLQDILDDLRKPKMSILSHSMISTGIILYLGARTVSPPDRVMEVIGWIILIESLFFSSVLTKKEEDKV